MTRFAGIGGLATLVHVLSALLVREVIGLPEMTANALGWLAAVAISYFGHQRITFGVDANHALQLPRFLVISVGGLLVSSATVALVTAAGGTFALAMASVAVIVPVASYLLMQLWVFADREDATSWLSFETAVAAGVALAILMVFWGQQMNHDVIWYHVATRRWLAGAQLYTDIVEVNPPLAFYFTLPVVKLADLTGLSDQAAQLVVITLLTFVSLSLTGQALAKSGLFTLRQRAIVIAGTGAILIALTLRDFAQREHIFVVMFLPWIASAIDTDRRPSARLALLAAIGMCLKPFFAIFPLVVLLLLAAHKRSLAPLFSPSAFVFLLTGLGYVGAVALFHPAYLTDIMPAATMVYGAYGSSFAQVAFWVSTLLLALGLTGFWVLSRPSPPAGTAFFFTAALAGVLSYFIQSTGFSYHAVPFLTFGAIACLFALLDARCRIFAIVTLGLIANDSLGKGYNVNVPALQIGRVIEWRGNVESLLVLTTNVSAGPIVAVEADIEWASEYPAQWLIPGALGALARTDCASEPQRCADLDAIIDRNRDDVLRDILSARPDMIAVDNAANYFDTPFEWQEFLANEQPFAEVMAQYSQIGEDFRFTYWVRRNLE